MDMDFEDILLRINKNYASKKEIEFFKRNVLNQRIDLLPRILMSSNANISRSLFNYWKDPKSAVFVNGLIEEFESLESQGKSCKYDFKKFKSSIFRNDFITHHNKAVIIFFSDAPLIQIEEYPSYLLNKVLEIQLKYPQITIGYKMECVINTLLRNDTINMTHLEGISNIIADDSQIADELKDGICSVLKERPSLIKKMSSNALANFIKISETLRMNAKVGYDINSHHMVRKKFERLDNLHQFIKNKSIEEFKTRTDNESVLLRLIY